MANLTGNRISDTFKSLLKFVDNLAASTGLKRITDGLGNNTALSLGDNEAKVHGSLEVDSINTPTGTSSQFLKADGSVDSTTYLSSVPTLQQVTDSGDTTTTAVTIRQNGVALTLENTEDLGADTSLLIRGARNAQSYASDNLTAYVEFANYDNTTTPNNYTLSKIGGGMYDPDSDTGFFQIQVNNGTSLVKALDIEKTKDATFYGNVNILGSKAATFSNLKDITSVSEVSDQLTIDFSLDTNNYHCTADGNVTFVFSNIAGAVGKSGTIMITNNTALGTVTLPLQAKTPLGLTPDWVTTAGAVSLISFYVFSSTQVLVNYLGDFK